MGPFWGLPPLPPLLPLVWWRRILGLGNVGVLLSPPWALPRYGYSYISAFLGCIIIGREWRERHRPSLAAVIWARFMRMRYVSLCARFPSLCIASTVAPARAIGVSGSPTHWWVEPGCTCKHSGRHIRKGECLFGCSFPTSEEVFCWSSAITVFCKYNP